MRNWLLNCQILPAYLPICLCDRCNLAIFLHSEVAEHAVFCSCKCLVLVRAAGGESPPPEAAPGTTAEDGADGEAAGDDHARPSQQDAAMLQGVVFHALESRNDGVLWDVQPAFVVMVDSDVAFVRQLEVTHHPSPSAGSCPSPNQRTPQRLCQNLVPSCCFETGVILNTEGCVGRCMLRAGARQRCGCTICATRTALSRTGTWRPCSASSVSLRTSSAPRATWCSPSSAR